MGTITLKNKDIKKKLFDSAHFIFWAADGAMGDAGAVRIVTGDGKSYYCNYMYGDADIERILKACPLIKTGPANLPEDLVFHYLGMGNFLIFRKEYEEKYNELLGEGDHEPGYEYQRWLDIALRLCRGAGADEEDYDIDKLRGTGRAEDNTVFIAWEEGGSGFAGVIDDNENISCIEFGEGVSVKDFYPVDELKNDAGWIYHDDIGYKKYVLMNIKFSIIFMEKGCRKLTNWLLNS